MTRAPHVHVSDEKVQFHHCQKLYQHFQRRVKHSEHVGSRQISARSPLAASRPMRSAGDSPSLPDIWLAGSLRSAVKLDATSRCLRVKPFRRPGFSRISCFAVPDFCVFCDFLRQTIPYFSFFLGLCVLRILTSPMHRSPPPIPFIPSILSKTFSVFMCSLFCG